MEQQDTRGIMLFLVVAGTQADDNNIIEEEVETPPIVFARTLGNIRVPSTRS